MSRPNTISVKYVKNRLEKALNVRVKKSKLYLGGDDQPLKFLEQRNGIYKTELCSEECEDVVSKGNGRDVR